VAAQVVDELYDLAWPGGRWLRLLPAKKNVARLIAVRGFPEAGYRDDDRAQFNSCPLLYSWMRLTWQSKIVPGIKGLQMSTQPIGKCALASRFDARNASRKALSLGKWFKFV